MHPPRCLSAMPRPFRPRWGCIISPIGRPVGYRSHRVVGAQWVKPLSVRRVLKCSWTGISFPARPLACNHLFWQYLPQLVRKTLRPNYFPILVTQRETRENRHLGNVQPVMCNLMSSSMLINFVKSRQEPGKVRVRQAVQRQSYYQNNIEQELCSYEWELCSYEALGEYGPISVRSGSNFQLPKTTYNHLYNIGNEFIYVY